jgi:hypothetical protein
VCVCVCVWCEFLAHVIVPFVKTSIVLYGFGPDKKVIELADQYISLKKCCNPPTTVWPIFLVVATKLIYGCVSIRIILRTIVGFTSVVKLKDVFGQQTYI